ncbi:MAG: glutamate 5-kinase [Pseudomonadales bacterium]|nr:glutamate 5-kinase [Pseudomonadales bacterium]
MNRWVIKIGSSSLTPGCEGGGLDTSAIDVWAEQVAMLVDSGAEVVLVSSGAIAEGCHRLGFDNNRSRNMHELQAAAAVGQVGLIEAYERAFQCHGMRTALVLLTHEDLSDRTRYLNARSTLRTLLKLGVIPVINENDTVVTDEIKFGDNDTLAALVSNLVEADMLVLLTDQSGLHDKNPTRFPDAKLVEAALASDPSLDAMAGRETGAFGSGGMFTKLRAARTAARSGAITVICDAHHPNVLLSLANGEQIGTRLSADLKVMDARKRWIAGQLKVSGTLTLDSGAVNALQQKGRSLLAVGVQTSRGNYVRGDMVLCTDTNGVHVAKGLVNYAYFEAQKMLGLTSGQIERSLDVIGEPELIHRDNLVVI